MGTACCRELYVLTTEGDLCLRGLCDKSMDLCPGVSVQGVFSAEFLLRRSLRQKPTTLSPQNPHGQNDTCLWKNYLRYLKTQKEQLLTESTFPVVSSGCVISGPPGLAAIAWRCRDIMTIGPYGAGHTFTITKIITLPTTSWRKNKHFEILYNLELLVTGKSREYEEHASESEYNFFSISSKTQTSMNILEK